MARVSRQKSESGIYHVMLRGINKEQIFFDDKDYDKFINILLRCKSICHFELYAYCIMPNHVHLLLKETDESVSQIMKRIGCRFVYWYNAKYERVGHLFQDRFKSEPVEDDSYFLSVLRYIHDNPVAAGLCRKMADYPYSSYRSYFEKVSFIDKDFVFSMINEKNFLELHRQPQAGANVLEIGETRVPLSEEKAMQCAKKVSQEMEITDFQQADKTMRKKLIIALKENGLSIRQIAQVTGYSKYLIESTKE